MKNLTWEINRYFAMHYDLQDNDGTRFETTLWDITTTESDKVWGNALPKAKLARSGVHPSLVEPPCAAP